VSRTGAVLVAAGSSTRFGGSMPKQFHLLGIRPLFIVSMDPLLELVDEIAVVVAAAHRAHAEEQLRVAGLMPGNGRPVVHVVDGGARRQDSVRAGLSALSPEIELVLIHDAARPFATPELAGRVLEAATETGAAVPAVAVPDTVKREDNGEVVATLDRSVLRLIQTPQGFRREIIEAAYAALGDRDVTDDAGVVELSGASVAIVDGVPGNRKITCASDLDEARLLAGAETGLSRVRVGFGADWHELVPGRKLILGGIEIPFEKGLLGHSDADVLTHAVCDALLGAAAAGDIGVHFPPDDPSYKDASSVALLGRVIEIIARAGLVPTALDAVVVAQAPKLAPHIPAMREMLARAAGLTVDAVSIKATTTEGLGPEGEGKAISATAVAVTVPSGPGDGYGCDRGEGDSGGADSGESGCGGCGCGEGGTCG